MLKRLCLASFILVVLAAGWFYLENRYEIDYKRAQDAFVSGGDEKAFSLAKKLYKSDITNYKYRQFFLDTIKRMRLNYEAQEELLALIDDGIYDVVQTQAIEYMHDLEKALFEKYQPNYIEYVPYNNKIIRWGSVPIRVKIPKTKDLNLYFINEVERAFMEWQRMTDNKIAFQFDDNNPNITIEFTEIPKEEKENNDNNVYVVANTEPEFDEDVLRNMKITLYTKNDKDKYFSPQEIYNTALHEIAHALGVFGHSRDADDVLYFAPNKQPNNQNYKTLSKSDVNTIKLLYDIKPDLTYGKAEYSIHPKLIFRSLDDINETKIQEANNYIKQAPSLPNGYIDLAQTAMYAKDYDKAKNCLKQAIKYANDNNTKFIIYYNFAVICYETGDMNKALFYAQEAQKFRNKNSVTALLANIYYKKREYKNAIEQYKILVKNHPTSVMYSVNLAKLYINRLDIVDGVYILKNLVKNNPEAADDKRVKRFKFLMMIVK